MKESFGTHHQFLQPLRLIVTYFDPPFNVRKFLLPNFEFRASILGLFGEMTLSLSHECLSVLLNNCFYLLAGRGLGNPPLQAVQLLLDL